MSNGFYRLYFRKKIMNMNIIKGENILLKRSYSWLGKRNKINN